MEHKELKPELKSCPFCGGNGAAVTAIHFALAVMCKRGTCFGEGPCRDTEAEAIAAWNTRTDPTKQALVEALESLVNNCADYEAWQRPCLAFDKARAALDLARK